MWFSNNLWEHTYRYDEVTDWDKLLTSYLDSSDVPDIVGNNKLSYLNCPASFDIETTSIYKHDFEKGDEYIAIMYHWQFGINGLVILGRTWDQYVEFITTLSDWLGTSEKFHLVVYVHNLQFEFQFMKDWFQWEKVFAIRNRVPLYAIDSHGIEYRCSYRLSGYSLDYIGKKLLHTYDCKKRKGDLDYNLIRHSSTLMTKEEEEYCINDVRVVMCYIQEKLDSGENIDKIPLTQTGYVRRYVRENTLCSKDYSYTIKHINYNNLDEFLMHRTAYAGGHTHAGVAHANATSQLVGSADLTSSYPASMCLYKFPMSSGTYIGNVRSYSVFESYLQDYCCVFDIEFVNLRPIFEYENILPVGKGITVDGSMKYVKTNNGKVVAAKSWCTTLNEVDFEYVCKFYKWDKISIKNLYIYEKSYLPIQMINSILQLYIDKTQLKGVLGKELEYLHSKELLNGIYGMSGTNPIRDEFKFNDYNWTHLRNDRETGEKLLKEYNNKFNRFLAYHWAMYVTSYSRTRLYDAILEFGPDFIYCDTDSIKGINFSSHLDYFDRKNNEIMDRITDVSKHYKIPITNFIPVTIKGEKKPLGFWDIEHESDYLQFKSPGAKRYCYIPKPGSHLEQEVWVDAYKNFHEEFKDIDSFKKFWHTDYLVSFTCSGVRKQTALYWLWNEYGAADLIYSLFGEGFMVIPEYTGKLTSHIIDTPKLGYVTDYLGVKARYFERSGNCLEPAPFYMSQAREYFDFIREFKQGIDYMEEDIR